VCSRINVKNFGGGQAAANLSHELSVCRLQYGQSVTVDRTESYFHKSESLKVEEWHLSARAGTGGKFVIRSNNRPSELASLGLQAIFRELSNSNSQGLDPN
jgi:hypothetical protein